MRSIDTLARVPEAPVEALQDVLQAQAPSVVRGLAGAWPLVQASQASDAAAVAYLLRFANPALPVVATIAPPEAEGRIFYDATMRGFNFRREQVALQSALDRMLDACTQSEPPLVYVGATTLDTCLPGLGAENGIDLGGRDALASIWVGNRSRVPTHQDMPDNLACVAAGRRRFLLFPPDQLQNLYIGPLDVTPAGQPVSLVDPLAPDLVRYPRFAQAWAHAQVAELGPGDAIFMPGMWWHHIEALEPFNILVNYWWRRVPAWMDAPLNALMAAILGIRQLPAHERAIWQEVFRHHVFEFDEDGVAGHIPAPARGVLAPLDETRAANLRRRLMQRLQR